MTDLRYSRFEGLRMSRASVVMKRGVLEDAIERTAARACAAVLCTLIESFREVVDRVNSALSISIAST